MAVPFLQGAFTVGEVAPALFGRFDLARLHLGASTMRNMFVRYQGGASSKPGTAFVNYSKQTGRNLPPRLIAFQFSLTQGLELEFGHFYMRVIQNGAPIVERPFIITGVTQANPGVVTVQPATGVATATPIDTDVLTSYAPGDRITLAGGTGVEQAVLQVTTTEIKSLQLLDAGTGYAVADTITLAGGTPSVPAVLTVTGETGGAITSFTISPGSYTSNPTNLEFTQDSTSGTGTAATFQFALMQPETLSVVTPGVYLIAPSNPVSQEATTGTGTGALYTITTSGVAPLANDDWVVIQNVGGMTQLNNRSFIVRNVTTTSFELFDVYGDPIDTMAYSAYSAGGTASRIYTLETPYADTDLEFLKWTQSADVMSLCLVNQDTRVEYPPYDLGRIANDHWTLTEMEPETPIEAPATINVVASTSGSVTYQYVVTAVDPDTGSESLASPIGQVASAVDVAATAGTITITWSAVTGVQQYNIYKAQPSYSGSIPAGVLFGYAGTAYGTSFQDSNIVADLTQVPPLHKNPFARGQLLSARPVAGGTGYTTVGFTINTTTGSGAVLQGVLTGTSLSAIIVNNGGQGYQEGDTITVTGDGTGATAIIIVGPQSGTYPAVVNYLQQRRFYAYTLNRPDTYFLSQPGAYKNFDYRIPTISSDAITGNPWAVQVNGIQGMVDMPGGGIVFTGKDAWQLTGTGGSSLNPQPITPSTQQAQPQAFNGSANSILPLKIGYEILYVQSKGSIVRDISYNYVTNIYAGADLTLNSSHLFMGIQLREWCWAEEPYKIVWVVTETGLLYSLTFEKPQELAGWARHDTRGLYKSVSSVSEPVDGGESYIDAVYVAVQRFEGDLDGRKTFMIERFDNRLWNSLDDCWCVDSGLKLPQPTPDATLTAASAHGAGAIAGFTDLIGGQRYSFGTTAVIVDDNGNGPGTGCMLNLTIVGGVITAVNVVSPGANYTYPRLVITDPAGSAGGRGASAMPTLDNTTEFRASGNIFSAGNVGDVIRVGGGVATITAFMDATTVTANITTPIVRTLPDSPGQPLPIEAGQWTMTAPVSTVTGLWHLVGQTVTGLYDGKVLAPQVVSQQGTITLPAPATNVVIGLGFECQLQTLYADPQGSTVQGQRKKIGEVTVRIEGSRDIQVGSNQVDGSTLSPMQVAPPWYNMAPIENKGRPSYGSIVQPLYTGDTRLPVTGGYGVHGQVALQQVYPLPFNLLAAILELLPGDTPGVAEAPGGKK